MKPDSVDIGDNVIEVINDRVGLKFLYYSTFSLRIRGERLVRKYYKPESSFFLDIVSLDNEHFKKACAGLWVAIYLGGFGTRTRRGGGNLAVENAVPNPIEGIEFYCETTNIDELKGWLQKNLETVKKLCNSSKVVQSILT